MCFSNRFSTKPSASSSSYTDLMHSLTPQMLLVETSFVRRVTDSNTAPSTTSSYFRNQWSHSTSPPVCLFTAVRWRDSWPDCAVTKLQVQMISAPGSWRPVQASNAGKSWHHFENHVIWTAFNTIQFMLLQEKCHEMRVDTSTSTWITDYLMDRPDQSLGD